MKKLFTLAALAALTNLYAEGGLPEKPKDGACYAMCSKKPVYKTEVVKVLVQPEFKRLKIVPAEYKPVKEIVVLKPASKKFVYVPATYKKVKKPYVEKEAFNKLAKVPEQFKPAEKQIEIKPKTGAWIVSEDKVPDCPSTDPNECKIVYYQETPAEFAKYTAQEKLKDETAKATPVAAVPATIEVEEEATPAKVEEQEIPAVTKEITRMVLVKDETVVEEVVPAVYQDIKTQIIEKESEVKEWREVPCKVDKIKGKATTSLAAPETKAEAKPAATAPATEPQYEALPVFYKLGSAELTADSKKVIDEKLYQMLVGKPKIKIMIMSHTDSRGSTESNLKLSKGRAKSVVDYLIAKGIDAKRLSSEGYGETKLVNKCKQGVKCSEAEHAKNRRTEFKVIE